MARKAAKPVPKKVFVVERLAWHFWYDDDDDGQPICHSGEDQGGVPVAAFADKAHAEALRAELERKARSEVCPFQFEHADPDNLTSKKGAAFERAIKKIGLAPPVAPEGGYVNWYHWWQNTEVGMTDGQREAMWALLDKAAFYRVSECELED